MPTRQTKFRRTMIGTRTLWGVDYTLGVINIVLAGMLIAAGHIWWWIFIAIGIHSLLKMAYSADPDLFRVYMRYVKQGHRYEPFPHENSRNRRPEGWG